MSRLKATYIKNLRVEKGMTQQELADLVNVRRETIVRLENGNYIPHYLLRLILREFLK